MINVQEKKPFALMHAKLLQQVTFYNHLFILELHQGQIVRDIMDSCQNLDFPLLLLCFFIEKIELKSSYVLNHHNINSMEVVFKKFPTPTDWCYNTWNYFLDSYIIAEDPSDSEQICWVSGKAIKRDVARRFSANSPCMIYRNRLTLENSSIQSDRFYGCVIRAYQSMMAQGLMRYYGISSLKNITDKLKVLKHFTDSRHENIFPYDFSFERMFKQLADNLDITEIQYFKIEEVAEALEDIHKEDHHDSQGSCSGPLCIKSFKSSCVNFDEVRTALGYEPCSCLTPKFYCPNRCHKQSKSKPVILLISGIFNKQQGKSFYTNIFLRSQSIGGVTGIESKNKSFYTMGYDYQKDRMIILDPHQVQPATTINNLKQHAQTFFCPNFKCVPYKDISQSYGLGFYISNLQQLASLKYSTELKLIKPIFFDISPDIQSEKDNLPVVRMLSSTISQSLFNGSSLIHSKSRLKDKSDEFQVLMMSTLPKKQEIPCEEFILQENEFEQIDGFIDLTSLRRIQSSKY